MARFRREVKAAARGIQLKIVPPEKVVRLHTDPRWLGMILANLFDNAVEYSPAGSEIGVAFSTGQDGPCLDISNPVTDLVAADLPHLFERFYRGAAAARRASGTGMGLWIARGLLAVQRGRIWAENAADGGARFSILIPILPADRQAAEAVEPS